MFALSVVTIPAVSLRYRCGRAFSHSPTLVQVDAATMARLQADNALVVQVVQQGDTAPPAPSTENTGEQDTTQEATPAAPSPCSKPSRKPAQGKR